MQRGRQKAQRGGGKGIGQEMGYYRHGAAKEVRIITGREKTYLLDQGASLAKEGKLLANVLSEAMRGYVAAIGRGAGDQEVQEVGRGVP